MFSLFVIISAVFLLAELGGGTATKNVNKSDLVGKAPITTEQFKAHTEALEYLGQFNGRSYYIDRVAVDQQEALLACEGMDFELAGFSSTSEISWIFSKTTPADAYIWVGGRNYDQPGAFYWVSSGTVIENSLPFHGYENYLTDLLGLALSRGKGGLVSKPTGNMFPFLCSI